MKKKTIPKHPNKAGSFKNTSDSLKSGPLIAGALLLLIGPALLFLNENTNARRSQAIAQSGGPVTRLTPGRANPDYDGKLVYISGVTNIGKPLADPIFTPPLKAAIALKRQVEMYQWQEQEKPQTMKTVEGDEVTRSVPKYTKVWSSQLIDSSAFKQLTTHRNPLKMPFQSKIFRAPDVNVGGFKLSAGLANQLDTYQALQIKSKKYLSPHLKNKVRLQKNGYFIGDNPDKPKIGDTRVTLQGIRLSEVSIIAKQEGNAFKPYITGTGKHIELLRQGLHNAEDMLPMPQPVPLWILLSVRLGGFILIYSGIHLIFKAVPASDPKASLFARLAAVDAGLSAILMTPALVLFPIAIAWIMVQPLSGGVLLIGAILLAAAGGFVLKWLADPSSASEKKIALSPKIETEVPSTSTNASTKKLTASNWLKKGQKMYQEENFKGAIDAFASAVYLDSNFTLAYYNRAITYQKAGQSKLAIIDLKSAARLGHKKAQTFLKAKKIVWE